MQTMVTLIRTPDNEVIFKFLIPIRQKLTSLEREQSKTADCKVLW